MENKPNNQSAQEVDVEKLAIDIYGINESFDNNGNDNSVPYREGFVKGYNQALQSKAGGYSLKDVLEKVNKAYEIGKSDGENPSVDFLGNSTALKNFIQSLTPTPIQTKGREVKTCPNCKSIKVGMVYEFHKCYDCEEMW